MTDYARQAIVTKYFGPTNARGSRMKATAQAGSVYADYLHNLNTEQNHRHVAEKFSKKYGWDEHSDLVHGCLPNGDHVFITVDKVRG